jgi:hypothetical protein
LQRMRLVTGMDWLDGMENIDLSVLIEWFEIEL